MTLYGRIAVGGALVALAAAGGMAVAIAQEAGGGKPDPAAPAPGGEPQAADPHAALVERLGDPDFAVRSRAYEDLRAAGKEAREALRRGARSKDAQVRWSAGRLLRLLDGPGKGERLPSVLRFRGSPDEPGGDPAGPGAPGPFDEDRIRLSLESLRERIDAMERGLHLRLGGSGGELHAIREEDGERTEVRRDAEGRVKVTLTRRGEDGEEETRTFEADSLEALEKEHPEAHAKAKPLLGVREGLFGRGFRFEFPDPLPMPDAPFRGFREWAGDPFQGGPGGAEASRPVLGVGVAPVPPVLRTQLGIPEDEGLVVETVSEDSLAARLGLLRHDVILRVNGLPVSTAAEVRAAVAAVAEGAEVRLDVLRAGQRSSLTGTR
jgi:hypothetical protein